MCKLHVGNFVLYQIILSEIRSECQTVWIQIRPDVLCSLQRLSADDTADDKELMRFGNYPVKLQSNITLDRRQLKMLLTSDGH